MSFGYSSDFRSFEDAHPPVPPPVPPSSGGQNGGSSRTRGLSLRSLLLWSLFLVLVLVVIAFVVNVSLEQSGRVAGIQKVDSMSTETVPLDTPTPAPTVLVVNNANPPVGNIEHVGSVIQPNVVYVPYPVIVERQVVVPQVIVPYAGSPNVQYVNTGYAAGPVCGGPIAYVVRQGDTVFGLSRRFGVRPESIVSMNSLWDPNYIRVGQVLQIPCASTY